MRPVERRRFNIQLVLGAILTLAVVVADRSEVLLPFEQILYDLRCRHCQSYLRGPKPPVHMQIDGTALEELGRWPWPRSYVAAIVRELYAAEAKVVALDVLFSESSSAAEDKQLSEAFAAAPGTVIGVGLQVGREHDADTHIVVMLEAVLARDLSLQPDAARRQLESQDSSIAKWEGNFDRLFFTARKDAMARRIDERLDAGQTDPNAVFAELLPSIDLATVSDTSPLVRLFHLQWDQALRVREMRRFLRPIPAEAVGAYRGVNRGPPILSLTRSAAGAGFTNYDPDPGGKVRAIPLWIVVDGKMLPQLGLAAVCLKLGVKPEDVRFSGDNVIIPRAPPEKDLVIPVHTHDFSSDKGVAYCMNVPMFGTVNEWASMYDFPKHESHARQFSVLAAYRNHLARLRIARNEAVVDAALIDAMKIVDPEFAESYPLLAPELRPRREAISSTLAKVDEQLQEYALFPELPKELMATRDGLLRAQSAMRAFPPLDENLNAVLHEQRNALRDLVKGQTVFIGFAADGQDLVPTPLHERCPGVVVHGAIYNAIMSGELWTTVNPWYTVAITIFLGFLTTLLVARLSPVRGLMIAIIGVAGYAAINGILLFDYGDLIVGAAGPITAIAVVWAALTLTRVIDEIGERNRITRRFQSYVDPSLVSYVINHPELVRLEGEVREMSIVFTDLAGFTSLAERLGPAAVRILSQYKSKMVPVIRQHRGFVHCFMGDGIMFSYGAPEANTNHAVDAVITVLALQAALEEFNRNLIAEGHAALGMRVGVSTGNVIIGDSGGEDGCDYTAIGDPTNLGARLESANKQVGTKILLSQRTTELLEGRFLLRPIARLVVAGKSKSVMTYEPLALAEQATDEQKLLAAKTTEMFDHFVAGRFQECMAAADRLDEHFGPSKLSALYRDTCQQHIIDPPADFAGQIMLKEK